MIIYIIENKRLSKTENTRMYNIKYKNKIQHTTKTFNENIK